MQSGQKHKTAAHSPCNGKADASCGATIKMIKTAISGCYFQLLFPVAISER